MTLPNYTNYGLSFSNTQCYYLQRLCCTITLCVCYLIAQIHQQHGLQEANDGHNHLFTPETKAVTTGEQSYLSSRERFFFSVQIPVGLTWMAQTGAFRSTQKISSLSHKHTTAQTLSNLDIITHIKNTLK